MSTDMARVAIGGATKAGSTVEASGLDPSFWRRSLFEALVDASRIAPDAPAVEDQDRQPLSRKRLILAAAVLGRRLSRMTKPGERVGVLLPNVNGAAVVFFALAAYGRVPAMLNFSTGLKNLEAACLAADIRTIVTSAKFVQVQKLDDMVAALGKRATVLTVETIRKEIGPLDKTFGAAYAAAPSVVHRLFRPKPDDIGAVLFTSGTEGVPKGVALSNANLLANCAQVLAIYGFTPQDVFFNALPVFHSFGLTAGLLLPVFGGFKSFLYPSPLHFKQIPKLVGETGTTILLSTDTFAAAWGKAAGPDDFATVKFTILGAERVKEATRTLWRERFKVELNEGYGVTEASPVLAVNRPGADRQGTVGKLLPGIEARLEPVPGLDRGGRLIVRGPNLMTGYLKVDQPGVLQKAGDWYDTGDIVEITADGFVMIRGRAKRFAKIGGEMVSLAAVEAYAAAVWPEASHAVVAVPDDRKGEALVLVTDAEGANTAPLLAWAREHGVAEILVPKTIVSVPTLPVLGTGKLDYPAIERAARGEL
ncbi:AMP-binding protein [Chthonobacter rhizosphaerae]|uniref:AMP-binding protein n=1 Tax=Chthonobacter rhizosphaerae TaxID=2735553 RepID=UPI001FE6BE2D|nr:AMP-binding protein [Chthonobacter rhizosphaerae]